MSNTDYMAHHGILGQKWGKRNGPPYPLDAKSHSASEKKAGWRKSLDKSKSASHTKRTTSGNNDEDGDDKFHLTENQKKAIKIGAAATATILVAYGGYRLTKSGKIDVTKLASIAGKLIDKTTGLEKLANPETISDTLKAVNPKYSDFDRRYNMNCGNCAIAFEARLRGFNVEAGPNPTGMTIASMGQFFKGFKSESFKQIDIDENLIPKLDFDSVDFSSDLMKRSSVIESTMKKSILSQCSTSDGRGMLFFPANFGSHWITWVKSGNDVTFYNPQNPSVKLSEDLFPFYKYHRNSFNAGMTSIRLDDLEINGDAIQSVIKNKTIPTKLSIEKFDTFVVKGKDFVTKYT